MGDRGGGPERTMDIRRDDEQPGGRRGTKVGGILSGDYDNDGEGCYSLPWWGGGGHGGGGVLMCYLS